MTRPAPTRTATTAFESLLTGVDPAKATMVLIKTPGNQSKCIRVFTCVCVCVCVCGLFVGVRVGVRVRVMIDTNPC